MQPRVTRRRAIGSRARHLPGLLAFVAAIAAGTAIAGQPWAPQPLVEWRGAAQQPQPGISLDRAVAMAEQQYKARVVRAGTGESEGRRVYVLRLLSDQGRVWTVRVDAETGAMN
jgi:uncharacterized membrane protein YkoI